MATYSEVTDLLVGDMTIGGGVDKDRFVQDATDEVNSRLGFVYVLPLDPAPAEHITLMLKRCANLIATGRLILAVASGGEDTALHAYGESLLREGQNLLEAIACGQVDLGAAKVPVHTDGNAPIITQADSVSAVDAFYSYVNGYSDPGITGNPIWTPNR